MIKEKDRQRSYLNDGVCYQRPDNNTIVPLPGGSGTAAAGVFITGRRLGLEMVGHPSMSYQNQSLMTHVLSGCLKSLIRFATIGNFRMI